MDCVELLQSSISGRNKNRVEAMSGQIGFSLGQHLCKYFMHIHTPQSTGVPFAIPCCPLCISTTVKCDGMLTWKPVALWCFPERGPTPPRPYPRHLRLHLPPPSQIGDLGPTHTLSVNTSNRANVGPLREHPDMKGIYRVTCMGQQTRAPYVLNLVPDR